MTSLITHEHFIFFKEENRVCPLVHGHHLNESSVKKHGCVETVPLSNPGVMLSVKVLHIVHAVYHTHG